MMPSIAAKLTELRKIYHYYGLKEAVLDDWTLPKCSTRLCVFLYLKTEAQPTSEMQPFVNTETMDKGQRRKVTPHSRLTFRSG